MPEDFVPSTTMERAYVQARHWPADRAWRRAYVQMSEGQVAPGVGMYLCLLNHYARRDGIRELFETCEWLLTRMENLKPAERLSMCRIVCNIVKSLKEDEFDVREARLKLILRIPLAVILDAVAEQRLSCALTGLLEFSRVFEESITIKQCSDIEGDFMGVALAIDRAIRAGNVRDKVKASETKSREEYDRERMEAINMADVIQEKLKKQNPELSEAAREDAWKAVKDAVQVWRSATGTNPPTVVDKLEKAQSEVEAATKAFGLQSDQVAHKLADLIVVKSEHFPEMVLDADIQRLNEIVADESIDISPYVLRKILSAVGAADERKGLLAVLTAIEKSILFKRERQIGVDISLGITLWRLICLWRANDSLAEGSAYCELLRQRITDARGVGDPVVRQVSSAVKFIGALKAGRFKWRENFLGAQSKKLDEAAEFAAMLSTIALDDIIYDRLQNAELVMNELLCFYSDTVGDTSRQVGEMLWLLQETQLNQLQKATLSLIGQSQKCARDEYLVLQFNANLRRLLGLLKDAEHKDELLAGLLAGSFNPYWNYSKTVAEVKQVLALSRFKYGFDAEAKVEFERAKEASNTKPKSHATLKKLERRWIKDWDNQLATFKRDRTLIDIESSFYRLVQIGLNAASAKQFAFCESIIGWLDSETSPSRIDAFNHLTEEMKRMLIVSDEFEYAAIMVQNALGNRHQTPESRNRLRLQLAELKVKTGNLFEATVLIYQAFSDIPDANYDSTAPLQLEGK